MTLVELLVVLGIIGLILGISVPGLSAYANQARLKAATRNVVGLLSLARSLAPTSVMLWKNTSLDTSAMVMP